MTGRFVVLVSGNGAWSCRVHKLSRTLCSLRLEVFGRRDATAAVCGDCENWLDFYENFGTVTPIMSPSRTIAANCASFQPSVPAGRTGSTIQR